MNVPKPLGVPETSAAKAGTLVSAQPGIVAVGVMLATQWLSEIADTLTHHHLDRFGVRPHRLAGLKGIPLAPFLHAGFGHLIGNSVPFAVLGVLIALSGLAELLSVTVIVTLISGLGMWVFGASNQVHIGASGVVFGYLAFLLVRGVFARSTRQIVMGAVVAVVYGGLLWGVLPTGRGVSWQGHLFGVVGGVVAARLLNPKKATAS